MWPFGKKQADPDERKLRKRFHGFEAELELMKVMDLAWSLNSIIRRNVDEGLITRLMVTEEECKKLHEFRRELADYWGQDVSYFENAKWLFEQEVKGES